MVLSQALQDALNEQLKQEFYSSYLYLAMAAYCDAKNLPGFAHWMLLQADEERQHAMRFFNFIQDRGGRVVLKALPGPPSDFASPLEVFEQALAHEQEISSLIEQLYQRAVAEPDSATQVFLQAFITEQVEEERTASQIVETLRLAGDNPSALLMIDRELAQRAPDTQASPA